MSYSMVTKLVYYLWYRLAVRISKHYKVDQPLICLHSIFTVVFSMNCKKGKRKKTGKQVQRSTTTLNHQSFSTHVSNISGNFSKCKKEKEDCLQYS